MATRKKAAPLKAQDETETPPPEEPTPDGGTPAEVEEPTPAEEKTEPEPPVDKARAQHAKSVADRMRVDAAVEAAPALQVDPAATAAAEEKAALYAELNAEQAQIDALEAQILECRDRTRAILNQIYPQLQANDKHADAVRKYVASQHQIRQNRALDPARLKAMLIAAGKAPIDAAFHRARARGMSRPYRNPIKPGTPPAADQAKGATPGEKPAAAEA